MYTFLRHFFFYSSTFFFWRNIIEIIFFASLFYYISLWLRNDKQKSLILYFYAYCSLTIISHYLQLTTIYTFLLFFAPVIGIFFIVIHQELLQRNFVTLKNIKPATNFHSIWLSDLISMCLVAINHNKEIRCIIECNDNLQTVVDSPFIFNAELNKELLAIVIESQSFDKTKMIWINNNRKLIGINATWKHQEDEIWKDSNQKMIPEWQQEALLTSSKTDALMFTITPETRTFDIIFNGKLLEQMSVNNALSIIKNHVTKEQSTRFKGEINYETRHQKNNQQQRPH